MTARLITRTGHDFSAQDLFETDVAALSHAPATELFSF
jgi:hypothetical protein